MNDVYIIYTAMVSSSIYLLIVRYCSVVPIVFPTVTGQQMLLH